MKKNKRKLIEIKNLKKSFKVGQNDVEILKGIDLTVNEGEFVIIFGPSGCGKSTLLHCLLGLEAPTSGNVTIEEHDFYSMSEDERALYRRHKVGMIYQQPLWISSLRVSENMAFPLRLLDFAEEDITKKIEESLDLVGMTKWSSYRPTELSSGQQQKISLARALMIDPVLIVADEPTGNLDTVSGRELLETFMKLQQKGKSIIMVTHDLEYLKYASIIYHIIDGEVVESYSPKGQKLKKLQATQGKKELSGKFQKSNVRSKKFFKEVHI